MVLFYLSRCLIGRIQAEYIPQLAYLSQKAQCMLHFGLVSGFSDHSKVLSDTRPSCTPSDGILLNRNEALLLNNNQREQWQPTY